MKVPHLFLLVILAVSSSAANLRPSTIQSKKTDIIRVHNEKRAKVNPRASKCIPGLKWDDGLARLAQAWSDRCNFAHGSPPEKATTTAPDGKPFGDRYTGQNLAMGTGSLSIEQAIKMWDEEKSDYNFCANKGTPGKMIGHYTQVVWAETTHVGCGKTKCPNMELITCDYWPGGNFNGCPPYASKKCGAVDRSDCNSDMDPMQMKTTCSGEPISAEEESAAAGISRGWISVFTLLAILVV